MTLDEYKTEVKRVLAQYISNGGYIDQLDADIERSFHEAQEVQRLLGSPQLSVGGYVSGILLLYPDLP